MAEFGTTIFPTEYTIQPVELARALEERGLNSLFVTEHTHIPASRRSPWPGGGELPKEYSYTYDPFVTLTACAAVTEKLKVGTGICLVVERDPIVLAKEVATIDRVSGGRFILGIGAGWNAEEMENHGVAFDTRWKVVREKILAMKELWTKDEAEFHGEFVDFDPVWSHPKPVQPGGPPIWMGATSKWSYDRIAEYCDGWLPIAARDQVNTEGVKAALEKRGRKLSDITLAMFGVPGKEEFVAAKIEEGFSHLLFGLPPADSDTVLPLLDKYAKIAEKMR